MWCKENKHISRVTFSDTTEPSILTDMTDLC